MRILVTGAAGFIGYHLCRALLQDDHEIVGIDNLSPYYDVSLKEARLKQLDKLQRDKSVCKGHLTFIRGSISDHVFINQLLAGQSFDIIVNLAAQAGVRASEKHVQSYVESNLIGFVNLLEACRHHPPKHFLFASSSSVYGNSNKEAFGINDPTDMPVSLYAASKKSNEVIAYSYAHLFRIPCTGMRFFTVYGPWGRPDMAYYKFTKAIINQQPIDVYNHGQSLRDFTYIDDAVAAVKRLMYKPPDVDEKEPPYRITNIGNSQPVRLMDFIAALEDLLKIKADKIFLPPQPGDVISTCADTTALEKLIGYKPDTDIKQGLEQFVSWYRQYV